MTGIIEGIEKFFKLDNNKLNKEILKDLKSKSLEYKEKDPRMEYFKFNNKKYYCYEILIRIHFKIYSKLFYEYNYFLEDYINNRKKLISLNGNNKEIIKKLKNNFIINLLIGKKKLELSPKIASKYFNINIIIGKEKYIYSKDSINIYFKKINGNYELIKK